MHSKTLFKHQPAAILDSNQYNIRLLAALYIQLETDNRIAADVWSDDLQGLPHSKLLVAYQKNLKKLESNHITNADFKRFIEENKLLLMNQIYTNKQIYTQMITAVCTKDALPSRPLVAQQSLMTELEGIYTLSESLFREHFDAWEDMKTLANTMPEARFLLTFQQKLEQYKHHAISADRLRSFIKNHETQYSEPMYAQEQVYQKLMSAIDKECSSEMLIGPATPIEPKPQCGSDRLYWPAALFAIAAAATCTVLGLAILKIVILTAMVAAISMSLQFMGNKIYHALSQQAKNQDVAKTELEDESCAEDSTFLDQLASYYGI